VILETADHIGAELIVLGSNCKSTLERLILGSVSQGVINNSKCPVIVAKTPCSLAREVSPAFGKVLVAVDNSVFSDIAVRWLANFRWLPTTQFIVSAVVPLDANFEEVENSLRERGTHLSQFLKTDNIMIDAATGSPEHEIVNLAKKHYADLIVMGSHGHSGLKEMVIGSVSDAVSHTAPCAVAIVRAPAFENREEDQSGEYQKAMQEDIPAPDSEHNDAQRARDDIYVHAMPAGMGGL
jgi:nucleotide-binding universal stress UspA family protein